MPTTLYADYMPTVGVGARDYPLKMAGLLQELDTMFNTGPMPVGGDLDVGGNVDVGGNLTVAGDSTFAGTVLLDSVGSANWQTDRAASPNYNVWQLKTAGVEDWRVGMLPNETGFAIASSADVKHLTVTSSGLTLNHGITMPVGENITWGAAYSAGVSGDIITGQGGNLYMYTNGSLRVQVTPTGTELQGSNVLNITAAAGNNGHLRLDRSSSPKGYVGLNAADNVTLFDGAGAPVLSSGSGGVGVVGYLYIGPGERFYLDDGSNTHLSEISSDVILATVGGVAKVHLHNGGINILPATTGGDGAVLRARYNSAGSNDYSATLDWTHLQLGSNGANHIISGRTTAGSYLIFGTNQVTPNDGAGGGIIAVDHECARMTASGFFKASNVGTYNSAAGSYHELYTNNDNNVAIMTNAHASDPYGAWINFPGASPNNRNSYFLACNDSTTSKAVIYSDGGAYFSNTVGVGTNAAMWSGEKLSISAGAGIAAVLKSASNGTYTEYIWNADTTGDNQFMLFMTEAGGTARGSVYYNRAGGLTAFATTSDPRSKRYVGEIDDAINRVMQLNPGRYRMNGASMDIDAFTADVVQEVAPYAVSGYPDQLELYTLRPKMQTTDNSTLVPLLTAAVQRIIDHIGVQNFH